MKHVMFIPTVCALAFLTAKSALAAGCIDFYNVPLPNAAFLNGKRIYAGNAPPGGTITEDWKEDHCSGGDLFKQGLGVGHPVDPYKKIGTWTDNGDGTITYDYGSPATTFTWKLYVRKGGGLCWEDTSTTAIIATGAAIGPVGSCVE